MTVQEVFLKQEHLEQCIDNLRSGKMPDPSLLADLLQEYYEVLNGLPVGFFK